MHADRFEIVRVACGVAFVVVGVLACPSVRAAPTARLVYSRTADAESCPDEADLRRAVAARVGYDPFFPWAAKTIVAHTAPALHQGFVVTIDLIDDRGVAHGARELRTDGDCRELLDAAALAIAIAIDPQSLTRPRAPAPAPPPASKAQPVPGVPPRAPFATPAIDSGAPASPASHPLRIEAGAGLVVSSGVAPAPAFGVALEGVLQGRRLSLGVEARLDLPSGRPVEIGNLSSWAVVGALDPCAHAGPFQVCGLAQVGSIQASGGPSENHRSALWLAAGGRLATSWALEGSTLLRVRTDIVGDLQRHEYWYNGVTAWTPPPVAFSFAVDVLSRF